MSRYEGGSVSAKVELDITEFRKTLETLKKDVEILKKGLSNFGTKQTGIEKEVKALRTEMEKLQRVNKTLSESNKSIKDDSRIIKENFNQQAKSLENTERHLANYVKENEKLTKSLKQVKSANFELNTELDITKAKLESEKFVAEDLANENVSLESTVRQLEAEYKNLNKSATETDKAMEQLKSENKSLTSENKKLANSVKELESETQKLKKELSTQNQNVVKDTNKATQAQNKEVEVLKKTEVQARKTGAALKQAFTKDLYNSIISKKGTTKGVLLRPVYDELKTKYKDIVKTRAEFEKLFADGLMSTNTSLYPSRDSSKSVKFGTGARAQKFAYINIRYLKKPFTELKSEAENAEKTVESSMNKSTQSTKKLENEVDKLTSKFKKLSSSTGKKHSLKQITNLGWDITASQMEKAGKALTTFEKNLNKTATTSKKTTQQIQSNFSQLDKEFTLSLFRNVKQMAQNGQVLLADVMQKLRMQYMSTITDWETFEKKFLKSMKVIGGEFNRVGMAGNSTVRFSHTDRGFDVIDTRNLKGLREIKAALEGVQTEAVQVEKTVDSAMNNTAKSTKKATNAVKELEQVENKLNVESKDNNLSKSAEKNAQSVNKVTESVKKSMDESTKSTERYKKSIVELGKAIKNYNKTNPNFTSHFLLREGVFSEQAELNEKWLKQTTDEVHKFLKGFANASIEVKRSVEEIDNAIRKFAQMDFQFSNKRALQDYLRTWADASIQVKRSTGEIEAAINKFVNTSKKGYVPIGGDLFKQYSNNWELTPQQLEKATMGFQTLERRLKSTEVNVKGFSQIYDAMGTSFSTNNVHINAAKNVLKLFDGGVEKSKAVLKEYEIQTKKTFETMQVELAKANAAQYKYWKQTRGSSGAWNAQPLQISGFSEYLSKMKQINVEVAKFEAKQKRLSGQVGHWKQSSIGLNTYKSKLTEINKVLDKRAQSVQRVKNAQLQLQYYQRTDYLNQYKANMGDINNKLAEQTKQTKNAELGIRKTGTSMVNAAHSGRILSNTLYQIRGALLSLKMIFTAMGGMALWGFATEIAEGIKTTFAAKNEMEAQLKQNSKVGASGIETFNRALDNTVSRFKKINKYALGETVSSIGLEFELTSKQMEKAMPIVSMIQSEYVRAGRTSEEAALAVKDILQGEFQRLSRETGVGKEELIAYGWDEDKTNIDGLLKALEKAAKDRHWDVFAAKATSLNDVIQITKSRFEEFGADFLQTISPAIVSGFNTLLESLTGLQNAFNKLGGGERNMIVAGSFLGLATTIGTALPMVTRGMGLADIATIGWGKSLATAALNLNKATVAQHGFRKALAEVITGTKASELANVRSSKAIMGRLLGVKQSVLAEHGYMTALVQSKGVLKNHTGATNIAKINSMGLAQKVAYLTNNMKLQEAQSLSTGRAVLKTATSWKVLRTAMLGVIGIAAIAWYSSMATWADTVRKNIEGLNEVIDNGDGMLKEAKSTVSDYETALSKLTKGTVEYKKADNNLKVAKANEKDITAANKLAKAYKKQNEETEKNIANRHKMQMARSYELAGIDRSKASEMASGWTRKVEAGEKNWIDSMNIYNDRLYKSNQHINEHIELMNKAGLSEEQRLKYIDEYSMKAEEVAENWKKFNQGDMTAGAYAVLGELQLQWIDLWNNDRFLNFWNSAKDTWEDIKPTVWAIKDALQELGNVMLDFFSTKHGQLIGGIALFGTAIGIVGLKVGKWVTGAKSTFDVLKKLGKPIKDRIKDWKDLGDKVEEANEKMGGDKSTGGIKGEKANSWFNKSQIQGDVQKYTRAAVAIAAGMALITEAIVLLNAPMLALAGTGVVFEHTEPQVKAGIKGLQLIAPTVIALMTPMIALMYVFNKFNITSEQLTKGFKDVAVGIALAITLVTEAIVLLNAPLLGLAILGSVYNGVEDSVRQGIKAMDIVNQALMSLVPWVPVFAAGIALAAIAFAAPEIGIPALAATALGIGIGIMAVTEALVGLNLPLASLAQTGQNYTDADMGNVKRGAEAMKITSEALGYVEEGVRAMMLVQWEMLASNLANVIAQLTGHNIGDDLVKLTEENGFLDQMEKFAQGFNNKTFTSINPDKAAAFKTVADSLNSLNSALESAKTAIANIPAEFKNGGNGEPLLSYDATTDTTAVTGSADTEGYFDQLKQPIEDLAKFMDWFNGIEITAPNPDKVSALTSSATMVEQINNAVEKVKNTMGNIAMGNIATNIAQTTGGGGWGMLAALNPFSALGTSAAGGGTGDYKSSVGSQLYEMEMVLTDLSTFNSKIAGIGATNGGGAFSGGSGGNAQALAGMVTAVSDAINQLSSTLSQAVPTIKQNATNIGKGISEGIKSGVGNLTPLVVPPLVTAMNAMKANAYTYGKGVGDKGKQGIKETFKVKETIDSELRAALWVMDSKKQHFYNKGYQLGQAAAQGVKDGDDMHSPGIMSRTFMQEMDYIDETFDVAIRTAPQKAYMLGETLANNFNPNLGLGGLSVDDLSQFQTGLDQISYMANSTDMQTSAAFTDMNLSANTSMTGMTTSVNGAFNNIQQNTTTKYGQLVNTTKTSLNSMQSQTTRNINAIKTSWRGMQNALIASAENIRNETGNKIKSLESNMASFWRKVQNPATLMGGAGAMDGHSIKRRSAPKFKSPNIGFAGNFKTGSKATGISDKLKSKKSKQDPSMFASLFDILGNVPLYAGGWHFNWAKDIQNSLLKWHTHFGDIYDSKLTVGKFENDDFPVRGDADIFKNYVFDAISRTHYVGYFNSRYGDDPVAAYNAGGFNCWDGANIVMALANAFGFSAHRVWGSWSGTPHVWAHVDGVGDIDATAIQQRRSFTSSAVRGAKVRPHHNIDNGVGNTTTIGDVNVNVTIEGNVDNPEETGRRIGEEASKTVLDILKRSPATGL